MSNTSIYAPKEIGQETKDLFPLRKEEDAAKAALPHTHVLDAFYPGEVWLDTQGRPIEAHGGAVRQENGAQF